LNGKSLLELQGTTLRVAWLSNPSGGRNLKAMPAVRRLTGHYPQVMHREATSSEQIVTALAEFATADPHVLLVNAGDGTLQTLFTALYRTRPFTKPPLLALVAGGSTNMNAGDVGSPGRHMATLKRVLDWCQAPRMEHARIHQRRILRVSPGAGLADQYGMFLGAGMVTRGVQYHHDIMHRPGLRHSFGSGVATLRMLWAMAHRDPRLVQPLRLGMGIDGAAAEPRELLLLFASTLHRLLHGFRPFWGGDAAVHGLHCTHIDYAPRHPFRVFPSVLQGRPHPLRTPQNGYHSGAVERLEILMDGPYTLDGEMHQSRIETGPIVVTSTGPLEFLSVSA